MFRYPVYQPDLGGNERKYVLECIDSTWISSKGKFIKQFEMSFWNRSKRRCAQRLAKWRALKST